MLVFLMTKESTIVTASRVGLVLAVDVDSATRIMSRYIYDHRRIVHQQQDSVASYKTDYDLMWWEIWEYMQGPAS